MHKLKEIKIHNNNNSLPKLIVKIVLLVICFQFKDGIDMQDKGII